jgi:rubrerythrin
MTYYSCEECGQMIDLSAFEGEMRREHCPVCEETTVWTPEFEADEGVSL